MINICVFGLGFVGLSTAVGFAKKGFNVKGYEIDSNKAKNLVNANIPFYEEGLQEALENVLESKHLFITDNRDKALENANVIFYCIGTPTGNNGYADLSYVSQAIKDTLCNLDKCCKQPILIIKSTIPPGSCKNIFTPLIQSCGKSVNNGMESDVFLSHNPEFLREGFAYSDFMNPDRILIGIESLPNTDILDMIYKPFNAPIIYSNLNTAEFIKYLSNTTLAMNISFANEMSMIAQSIGDINIKDSFNILHQDKRFSGNPANIISYLYPGLGFGGYCLPKDTLALYKTAMDNGYAPKILKDVLEINNDIIDFYVQKINNEVSLDSRIGILGLSFKPKSDDVRDSKSATLIQKLTDCGYKHIDVYDPIANTHFRNTYNMTITYKETLNEIIKSAEVFIIATAWEEFQDIFEKIPKNRIYNLRWL